jgi:hypothetical protein
MTARWVEGAHGHGLGDVRLDGPPRLQAGHVRPVFEKIL